MWSKWREDFGLIPAIFITFGALLILFCFGYVMFTGGYWLITLILNYFFAYTLPFSWGYSFGAYLIYIIISIFIAPSLFLRKN